MDTGTAIIIIGLVVILVVVVWFLFFKLKKSKKDKDSQIPENVFNEFMEAERRFKESNGRKSQREILWEIAREHFPGTGDKVNSGSDQTIIAGEHADAIRPYAEQRPIVQSDSIKPDAIIDKPERKADSGIKQYRGNVRRRFQRI